MAPRKADSTVAQGAATDGRPAAALARLLGEKLDAAAKLVRRVQRSADLSSEKVHQLRVSTRRASAGLALCQPLLKRRPRRRIQRWLRRLRAAAAEVRKSDVRVALIDRQMRGADASTRPVLDVLARWARDERVPAERNLIATARQYRAKRMRRLRDRLITTMKPKLDPRISAASSTNGVLNEYALEMVHRHADEVRAAASADLARVEGLHGLRIAAKKLRYILDLIQPLVSWSGSKKLLAELEQMQDQLGALNDSFEMAAWLDQRAVVMAIAGLVGDKPENEAGEGQSETLGRRIAELAELHSDDVQARIAGFLVWMRSLAPRSALRAILGRAVTAHAEPHRAASSSDRNGDPLPSMRPPASARRRNVHPVGGESEACGVASQGDIAAAESPL